MKAEFLEAIKAGDADRTRSLIDSHPGLLNAKTDAGVSGVLFAMYHGQPAIARLLIERGAELDLFDACGSGAVNRVRELAAKENVNTLSPDGFPPLGLACYFGHDEIARLLVQVGADVNLQAANSMRVCPIHAAAARRSAKLIALLLEHGADPDARQQAGYTALHAAAQNGDREIAEMLLAAGARRGAATDDGRTPASLARQAGYPELAQLLEAT